MPAVQRAIAYAKVNLFLEITDQRADGYHLLSTLFQTISLADRITLQPSKSLTLTCSDSSLPADERNLALRAAIQLRERLGESKGAAIHLEKKIPMGAGLGGGSADAAAILLALAKFWRRQPSADLLHKVAIRLGADVPFFLKGGTCAASGIGDRLKPLPKLAKTWLVLVYPGFGVSTKEAYARVRVPLTGKRSIHKMTPLFAHRRPSDWVGHMFNRFEEFVFPGHPQLPKLKSDLIDAGAIAALMSGSGSSIFGVAESESKGKRILAAIQKKYRESWLVHTV